MECCIVTVFAFCQHGHWPKKRTKKQRNNEILFKHNRKQIFKHFTSLKMCIFMNLIALNIAEICPVMCRLLKLYFGPSAMLHKNPNIAPI